MTIVLTIVIIACAISIVALPLLAAHRYRERWRVATSLLELDLPEKGTWYVERYTGTMHYTAGDLKGKEFQGVLFRLVNDVTEERIKIREHPDSAGVDPSHPNADLLIKQYRARAQRVADQFNEEES